MAVETAVKQVEQVRASLPQFLVHCHSTGKNRVAACLRPVPAGEQDHRRIVGVWPQLEIAVKQARRDLLARRVDDVADQLALGVLRERATEVTSNFPHFGDKLSKVRAVCWQAAEHHETPSRPYFLVCLPQRSMDFLAVTGAQLNREFPPAGEIATTPVHEPSALIPASRMIFAKASGDPGTGSRPASMSRLRTSSSARTAPSSRLRRRIISRGVARGASTP